MKSCRGVRCDFFVKNIFIYRSVCVIADKVGLYLHAVRGGIFFGEIKV